MQKTMLNQRKAIILGILVVLFWSTVSSAFKLGLNYLPPALLLLYSAITSAIALLIVIIFQGKFISIFNYGKKQYINAFLTGLLNPFIYFIFLFKAYYLLPAQEAQAITYTWPISMTILAIIILKQKFSKIDIAASFICYLGILIIITHGHIENIHFSNIFGILFALTSTVIWSVYWIINTKQKSDPIINLFLNFIFALPLILIYCYFFTGIKFSYTGFLWAAYVGLFEMGIAFVLWLYALKYAENKTVIINLTYLTPLLALFFINILTGEKILNSTIIGILIILLGIIIQNKFHNKNKKNKLLNPK
ncbi:MAG TPA: DMT family transporter [Victivallales bacterium]|nr:DMT family transporter [Victivallales bacterium]